MTTTNEGPRRIPEDKDKGKGKKRGLKIGQLIGLLTWIESNPEEKNPSIQLLYAP
jgi:hypothetical protein